MWNINTGYCLHTLQGSNKHHSAVTSLQFSENFVVTSSDDGTVKLWDIKTGEFIRNLVQLDSGGSGKRKESPKAGVRGLFSVLFRWRCMESAV